MDLYPVLCDICGKHIGWSDFEDVHETLYCENCKKEREKINEQ